MLLTIKEQVIKINKILSQNLDIKFEVTITDKIVRCLRVEMAYLNNKLQRAEPLIRATSSPPAPTYFIKN